ncbi:YhcN/YlaJ family sporulation lipoprotein [Bacillus sp. CGMCC 1.16607]|uniref:YhcN/YlaJ family sporulation lipoprotein n=1 Tax=Bacillus sp. CGMCC 1.16607 TaxID=3351842 RepID=UPI00363D76A9
MKIGLLLLTLLFIISGCNNNGVVEKQQQNLIQVKNSTLQEVDRKTGQEIAQHLVKLTSSMPNINDATAVVIGKYAIVGIDVKENIDRSQVGSIKYSVAESLKNDPYGAKAIVIADPDLTARLKEISEDIENGEPIQGIINELADISGRLMPEIPADIIDPKPKSGIEDSKKQLNKSDQKNLNNKQEKQSNHHLD